MDTRTVGMGDAEASSRSMGLHSFLKPRAESRYALIILNQSLANFPLALLQELWVHYGGANRLYDALNGQANGPSSGGSNDSLQTSDIKQRLIPNLICGDLDSLRPDVANFYRGLGVRIEKSNCQDTTDLDKSIRFLQSIERMEEELNDLLIIGGTGGRFDQSMTNIHSVYRLGLQEDHLRRVFLLDDQNLLMIIPPGRTSVNVIAPVEGPHCGLMPLGQEATVSSHGLKWNLDRTKLSFGGLISTCNHVLYEGSNTLEKSPSVSELSFSDSYPSPARAPEVGAIDITMAGAEQLPASDNAQPQTQLPPSPVEVGIQRALARRRSMLQAPIPLHEEETLGVVTIDTDVPIVWSIEVHLAAAVVPFA
ncbi:cAMP-dependent protein kinase subunit [Sorochytrium milnesiophthora]